MDDECIHGLVGCAPCQGIDEGTELHSHVGGEVREWSSSDKSTAADRNLTTHTVAARLGRTTSQVSAMRSYMNLGTWAGHVHKGH